MVVHIVEDDPAVADAIAIALADLEKQSVVYSNGESFFAEGKVSSADLLILDLGLPGMSGVEVVQRLWKQASFPRIVAISGKSQMKLQKMLRDLPGLQVLRKPLSLDALTAAIA